MSSDDNDPSDTTSVLVETAFNRNVVIVSYSDTKFSGRYIVMGDEEVTTSDDDVLVVIADHKDTILNELRAQLVRLNAVKWYIAVLIRFSKLSGNGGVGVGDESTITTVATFHGRMRVLLRSDDVEREFDESVDKIMESITNWSREGSGWWQECVERIDLYVVKYSPLHASSYIATPLRFAHPTKGVINVRNKKDNKCFLWSVLTAIVPPKLNRRWDVGYLKKHQRKVNMSGINYPVDVSQIDLFESNNPSLSVNVFGSDSKNDIHPIRITKEKYREKHVDLLLLTDEHNGNSHYCLISNKSRLLAHLRKDRHVGFYCNYCLNKFSSRDVLSKHEILCSKHGYQQQQVRMPSEKNKWMYFKNYSMCHKAPYTIYSYFNCFIVPVDTCARDANGPYTDSVARHVPCGFCYVIVDKEGRVVKKPVVYAGDDVVHTFLKWLMDEVKMLTSLLKETANVDMIMNDDDRMNFDMAEVCHLCGKPFVGGLLGKKNNKTGRTKSRKVRNHDHFSGKYLGAAHNSCNLNYSIPRHIPVIFHNLSGYDCHLLMEGLGKFTKSRLSCIAKTGERYMSVTLGKLRFLDSLHFMNASLDTLVKNLASSSDSTDDGHVDVEKNFKTLNYCVVKSSSGRKENLNLDLKLLLRHVVYPHEFMCDESKFQLPRLPAKQCFYNSVTECHISDDDYAYAQWLWATFKMNSMLDYHNTYLLMKVLLLADVFENFRNTSMQYYEIDPCNTYSSPGLAWNAMLKMTGVKLELFTEMEQYLFVESGIRGGVSMIPTRYYKANNNDRHILYLDCNNLYGTAMSQPLPLSGFRWCDTAATDNNWSAEKILSIPDDGEIGYILEVDLHYPEHLHDLHSDYPLAPERMRISKDMLSPYNKKLIGLAAEYGGPIGSGGSEEKLVTTLFDKTKYVVHYRNLKLYLKMGLVLTSVHRVLAFKQSVWLRPFMEFNTAKRQSCSSAVERDFFKLMNNSIYGKSLQNVRKYMNFKLVNNEKSLLKCTSNFGFKQFEKYNENLVGMSCIKGCVLLDRPIYVGFTVLDISKLFMYLFHYGWAVSKYGHKNLKLCMTDTDSLVYGVNTLTDGNVYADIMSDADLFDTSDCPKNHPCFSERNKKVPGKFKVEMNGDSIHEFVGLRSKCYSMLVLRRSTSNDDTSEVKRGKIVAKGVSRVAIKNQLRHDQYKKCLLNNDLKMAVSFNICSDKHAVFTKQISKLALSSYDNKRYVLDNGIDTLPYGHYKIHRLRTV